MLYKQSYTDISIFIVLDAFCHHLINEYGWMDEWMDELMDAATVGDVL